MLDYQIVFILLFVLWLLSILIIGLTEKAIKKHKAKKQYIESLENENKKLKHKLYSIKFNAELRGLHIDD